MNKHTKHEILNQDKNASQRKSEADTWVEKGEKWTGRKGKVANRKTTHRNYTSLSIS